MESSIYYFSGTGNTHMVATGLADRLDARLTPIARVVDSSHRLSCTEVIGIVYPVYYAELPPIVARFAASLRDTSGAYIFAVGTYGGGIGISWKALQRIIEQGGGTLSAWFGIHMPQNAFRKPWENQDKTRTGSWKKIDGIAARVSERRNGTTVGDMAAYLALLPLSRIVAPLSRKQLCSQVGLPKTAALAEAVHKLDSTFTTDETCSACGLCVNVCPVDNIRIENRRPVWLGRCENCLACYNWCPKEAIAGGPAAAGYHYRHPEASARDIMRQRSAPEQ